MQQRFPAWETGNQFRVRANGDSQGSHVVRHIPAIGGDIEFVFLNH
jgi:hypothetical protein